MRIKRPKPAFQELDSPELTSEERLREYAFIGGLANPLQIVEEESAAPTLPDVERASIQADHSHMCKFENADSSGFDLIVDAIQRYSEQAPVMVKQRWIAEKQERLTQKLRKAKELVPGAIGMLRSTHPCALEGRTKQCR